MRTVYIDDSTQGVKLGFRQEHDYTEIVYTLPSDWEGVVEAFIKKPGANASVPLTGVTQTDGTVSFTLTRTDLIEAGRGALEYMCTMNGVVAKSKVFPVIIAADIISESTDRPDEWESWIDELTELAAQVRTDAASAAASATSASGSASSASQSASGAAQSAQSASESAESASESAQSASDSAADAEEAKNTILNMTATATTLPEGSSATVDYNNGVMAFGIPRGDKGAKGDKGDTGETGATPNLSIGTVETLAPDEDASVTIRGTAEAPILDFGLPKGETGDVSKVELASLMPLETVSGSVASFLDGSHVFGAEQALVTLEPVQDLHGYDKPWAGGAGANIWGGERLAEDVSEALGKSYDAVNKTIRITTSGAGDDESIVFSNGISFKENTRYTLITDGTASGLLNMMFKYTDGTTDRSLNQYPQIGAYVSVEGKTVANLVYRSYSGATVLNYEKCGLFEGVKTVADFTPYSNICPISGHTEVNTQRTGKNLLDPQTIVEGSFINGNVEEISASTKAHSGLIPVKPNTSYCLNGFGGASYYAMLALDADKNALVWYGGASKTAPFVATSPADAHYMILNFNIDQLDTMAFYESTTVDGYIAYNGDTYTTTLGRTVYGGTVDLVSGVLTVERAMVDLGTLNWSKYAGTTNIPVFYVTLQGVMPGSGNLSLCSALHAGAWEDLQQRTENSICVHPSASIIYAASSQWTSASDFKTAMDGQTFVYLLATPITYQLTPQAIALLTGDNNVWSDGGSIEVKYRANIGLYVDKKISEVNA